MIAVRGEEGVLLLDAASGQELSRVPVHAVGMALGSTSVLMEWNAVKDCATTVTGRNLRTGEAVWQAEASTRGLGRGSQSCVNGWPPKIGDGLVAILDPHGLIKVIEVDTGLVLSNSSDGTAVAVSRRAIVMFGSGRLAAFTAGKENVVWVDRLWAADVTETSTIAGVIFDGDRLAYTTEYEGSRRGIGWVRDITTGRRLWYADGARPLGVDGDRVIAEMPSGEIRLERMVSTG